MGGWPGDGGKGRIGLGVAVVIVHTLPAHCLPSSLHYHRTRPAPESGHRKIIMVTLLLLEMRSKVSVRGSRVPCFPSSFIHSYFFFVQLVQF